jgi:D-xylose transport system permease protein
MATMTAPDEPTTTAQGVRDELAGLARDYLTKIRGGDVGSLPAVLGLVVLVIVFTSLRGDTFTNQFNFANLFNQSAGVMVIAMGLVFVLLLGEIDLSAGFTGGTAAAVLGIVATENNWPWVPAIIACLATGAVIGLCVGLLVARLGIPSFVVTLAGFLGLQGVMLVLIGEGGTIAYRDETLLAIMNKNLPIWLGWTICLVGIAGYALVTFRRVNSRRSAGLTSEPVLLWAMKTGFLAAVLIWATYYLSLERSRNVAVISLKGVPIVVVVLMGLLVGLTFLLSRTAWGRHVYAVGGNAEAARRAGINVARIRILVFMIAGAMSALGGIILAARLNSVDLNQGGGTLLIDAIAAAVIGGTSLFGGRGEIRNAVFGALVIKTIENGLNTKGYSQGIIFIVTGAILLLAVTIDAVARRLQEKSGR